MPGDGLTVVVSRYAFRSADKAALQEIGPRFTLKLRSLKKGVPTIETGSKPPPALEFAPDEEPGPTGEAIAPGEETEETKNTKPAKAPAPDNNDFEWAWKVGIAASLMNPYSILMLQLARVGNNEENFLLVRLIAVYYAVQYYTCCLNYYMHGRELGSRFGSHRCRVGCFCGLCLRYGR